MSIRLFNLMDLEKMPSLESRKLKSGTSWRVAYYWNGSKEHVKIGVTTKRIVQQRRAQIEALLAMNKNPKIALDQRSGVKLSELMRSDAEWCVSRKRAGTVKINDWCMGRLIKWAGDRRVDEIDHRLIEKYLNYLRDDLSCNETTINMQLRTLKAIFQRAVDEHHYLREHLFRSVKPFISQRKIDKPKFLTQEQLNLLIENIADIHFKRLVKFYLLTGCRRTEAVELRWDEIDEQSNFLYIGQPDSQTKLRRSFPINLKLKQLLEDVSTDKGENELVFWRFAEKPPEISRRFQRLRQKVTGLPENLTTHILRHTFASHLVMNGVDISTVALLLGHSTTKVTELYAHLQPDHVRDAVERLPYSNWG